MSDMQLITFEPFDSLFFREAKPFNAGEGGFLDSQFPPSAQTLSGAIRGAIGDAANLDWRNIDEVQRLLGAPGDDPAPLSFAGPYLFKGGQRIYPVPLNLLYSEKVNKWTRLIPSGTQFTTDMGNWQLPIPEDPPEGAKPLEEGWLDARGNKVTSSPDCPLSTGFQQCLEDHGYRDNYQAYQPGNRFWLFQWIETSIYLVISVPLLGLTIWWIRYRLS